MSFDKIFCFVVIAIVARITDFGLSANLSGIRLEDRDLLPPMLCASFPHPHGRKPRSFQSAHVQESLECNEDQRPHGAGASLWNGG